MVAPITGRFARYTVGNVFVSLVAATGAATLFWEGFGVPMANKCEKYFAKVRAETLKNHEEWLKSVAAEK